MISLGSYGCSAVSMPSLAKGDTFPQANGELLWPIFKKKEQRPSIPLLSLSALRRIPTVTAEYSTQLPGFGPLAYGEYQVPSQLFPEQSVAQGMWLISACQGNEMPSPLCPSCPGPGTMLYVCV